MTTEDKIKETLILGMFALKFGYASSTEIAIQKQAALDYYLGRDFKQFDADQMRFRCLVDLMFFSIINAYEEKNK